jgi:hypothetical protein
MLTLLLIPIYQSDPESDFDYDHDSDPLRSEVDDSITHTVYMDITIGENNTPGGREDGTASACAGYIYNDYLMEISFLAGWGGSGGGLRWGGLQTCRNLTAEKRLGGSGSLVGKALRRLRQFQVPHAVSGAYGHL